MLAHRTARSISAALALSSLRVLLMSSSAPRPPSQVRFYATELVLALEHVHASCLIHRDVAPQSVIVATSGHVRLTSFGSASLVPYVEPGGELRIGMSSGVAPEMLLNGGYGASVDWWGLGCIMHQMFVGRRAHPASESSRPGAASSP